MSESLADPPARVVVIPARYASSRLPGKVLADIGGRPMIALVCELALAGRVDAVIVAGDDERILEAARAEGAQAILTSSEHRSGSERIAEAISLLGLDPDVVVVNIQADEPLLPPTLIDQVAGLLVDRPEFAMATLCEPIEKARELFDPAVVKVVFDAQGRALYFSRAPIPWQREAWSSMASLRPAADEDEDTLDRLPATAGVRHYRHIGLYAARAGFFTRFAALEASPAERIESLEQLRAMHHGHAIRVAIAISPSGPGVDTQADLERARALFAQARA
ncbi:MAG: 3-deoxy-manno-octulosonate cytidylyltransferase [Ectothiorhodospiraceae bacterium AqS1]|nr:3-deoxy-manno-octulosonate cytidylyltransferase [Ectothiorhodospiraceae bacterium AqS1]